MGRFKAMHHRRSATHRGNELATCIRRGRARHVGNGARSRDREAPGRTDHLRYGARAARTLPPASMTETGAPRRAPGREDE